jgi:membrane protease YdiL (CAAX protease family)
VDITNSQSPDELPVYQPDPIAFQQIPTPDNPPWNSVVAFFTWAASVLAIILLPSLFLIPYLAKAGIDMSDQARLIEFAQTDPTAVLLQIIAIIPAHVFTLLAAWLVVTRFRSFSFRTTLGWNSGGMLWWHYAIILGAFLSIAMVVGYYFPEQENDLLRILRSSRTAVFVVAFMATFTAPLVEEVIYRGVLYSAFQRTFGVTAAVFAVTVLFSLVHVPQYYPSYSSIFLITLISLILTLVRVKTGNLLPCIILHTIFNGFQSILLILEPYIPSVEKPVEQTAMILRHLQ